MMETKRLKHSPLLTAERFPAVFDRGQQHFEKAQREFR